MTLGRRQETWFPELLQPLIVGKSCELSRHQFLSENEDLISYVSCLALSVHGFHI